MEPIIVHTGIGAVLFTTSTTSVLAFWALVRKMTPPSAFHALDGFLFLLCWPDQTATDAQAVLDQLVSSVHRCDGQDSMHMSLACLPASRWLDLSCFMDYVCQKRVSLLDFSEVCLVIWLES